MLRHKKIYLLANNMDVLENIALKYAAYCDVLGVITENVNFCSDYFSVYNTNILNKINFNDTKIVIADNDNMVYFIRMLQSQKLQLIKDWIPHWLLEANEIDPLKLYQFVGKDKKRFIDALSELKKIKKIMLFNGNCQTVAIRYYLKRVKEFTDNYWIFSMPWFWIEKNTDKYNILIDLDIYKFADVFVTQQIKENNAFGSNISTHNLIGKLDEKCRVIVIPNVYSQVYYPQSGKIAADDKLINRQGLKLFKDFFDVNIYNMVRNGEKTEDILDKICDVDFYTYDEIRNRFEREIQENAKREESCDIKILDFIQNNLNKEILFESTAHPSECVMTELTKRLLETIGINDEVSSDGGVYSYGIPGDERSPIYPSVIEKLGLRDSYKNLLYKLPLIGEKVTFREYMSAYIRMVYGGKTE